jgi:predicted nuclease of predicted toxin-antitoxin system
LGKDSGTRRLGISSLVNGGRYARARQEIMSWARGNGYIVFTHDLDFGVLLALTRAESPSVIQVRTQDVFPKVLGEKLVRVLREHESVLEKGALLTVDEGKSRVRVLPFG